MAGISKGRMEILKEMAEGRVIKEFVGFGFRKNFKPKTYLTDRPFKQPGQVRWTHGANEKPIRYSDFKALFDMGLLVRFLTEMADYFYELTDAGKRAAGEGK